MLTGGEKMADSETPGLIASILAAFGFGGGGLAGIIRLSGKVSSLESRASTDLISISKHEEEIGKLHTQGDQSAVEVTNLKSGMEEMKGDVRAIRSDVREILVTIAEQRGSHG